MIVYTEKGTALTLREPELGKGGEGYVYAVEHHPNRVVKLYKNVKDASQRKDKIVEMVSISKQSSFNSRKLSDYIAWPMGVVYNKNGEFIGYGMQVIYSTIELDDIYTYPPEGNEKISIYDKVEILIDLCEAIDKIHAAGQVFADGNPNNIKIIANNKVKMIDADSYHIKSRGKMFRSIVCHPEYVAPELSKKIKNGRTYEEVPESEGTFTKESDRYSLAIHVFKMLMNGAHPFNYRDKHKAQSSSKRAPKKSLSERVENAESVYFNKNLSGKAAPIFAPDINSFPSYIIDLFKRAFITGATSPSSRPTASEWKSALIRFKSELKPCSKNRLHYYHKSAHSCPYCEADKNYLSSKLRRKSSFTQNAPKPEKVSSVSKSITPAVPTKTYTAYSTNSTSNSAQVSTSTVNNKVSYWLLSMLMSILFNVVFGCTAVSSIYHSFSDNSIITTVGIVGSIIAGVISTIVYNAYLSSAVRNNTSQYYWYDYVLSLLCSLGGMIALGLLLLLIVGILYIIYYIFVFVIVIVIIGVLLGG